MRSFVQVESDNNDIFRKAGANFNMMLIWLMYDDFTQNGWENRQKHMAELRDTLYVEITRVGVIAPDVQHHNF